MFIPIIDCVSHLLLPFRVCLLYHVFAHSQADVTPNLNFAEMHNAILIEWRLCKEFHYWTPGWLHALEMCGVILGVLLLRWRNPHWFLIRTCQVSIKEVPSPPLVSIEIRLTNKNSLAAVFAQSGLLLCCASKRLRCEAANATCGLTFFSSFLLWKNKSTGQLIDLPIFFSLCGLFHSKSFFFPSTKRILYMTYTCTHYMQDTQCIC